MGGAAFITRLDSTGSGPRLAVKDLIDVAGVPTTAGCRAVERRVTPAAADAPCLAGARAAGARIVGKANLHELAMLPIGSNPWFGTPVNPLDAALIPGGSSSGSAVAVAAGDADVAYGSDTGGSVRIPAACCGVAGLKTTHGRVSLAGVWPLVPSLDTVGPMAADIAGLVLGMQLLEPGFEVAAGSAVTVGRLPTTGDPELEAAVDAALAAAELAVVPLDWEGFAAGPAIFTDAYFAGVTGRDLQLLRDDPDGIGADVRQLLSIVESVPGSADMTARDQRIAGWRTSLLALFERVQLLVLPTLPIRPPALAAVDLDSLLTTAMDLTANVALFNAAGVPALAQPVVTQDRAGLPGSLQLVGPPGSENLLLATAGRIESAAGWR